MKMGPSLPPVIATPPRPPKRPVSMILIIGGIFGGFMGCGAVSAILFPVFAQARIAAKRSAGLQAIHAVTTGMLIYTTDNDDRFPLRTDWQDRAADRVKDKTKFQSPDLGTPSECDIAFRARLSGRDRQGEAEDQMAILFDSTVQVRNASGELNTLPRPGRWRKQSTSQNLVAFGNGSAKFVTDGTPLR